MPRIRLHNAPNEIVCTTGLKALRTCQSSHQTIYSERTHRNTASCSSSPGQGDTRVSNISVDDCWW